VLNLYRRHLNSCANTLRSQKKCGCPIWAQGTLHGLWLKKSLDLRNWEAAQRLVREWESGQSGRSVPIKEACDRLHADMVRLGRAEDTVKKYGRDLDGLKAQFGGRLVSSISVDELAEYSEGWKLSPVTARKKLERLRTIFRFWQDRGWVQSNPAKSLKAPKGNALPTLPFTKEEIEKIQWAVDLFPNRGVHGQNTRPRIKAFVNVLLYSGLRIRDVTTLTRDKVEKGKLMLYTAKTKTPVWLPLPKDVLQDLDAIDLGDKFYFWTGNGSEKSGVSIWQRTLAKIFETAGIRNGHAHRFRDTFSVNLLQAGVPLETVSILLGHSSVRITEKHYAPWVKSRQVALTAEIEKAWKLG
jgi:integrase/recombinase XerD